MILYEITDYNQCKARNSLLNRPHQYSQMELLQWASELRMTMETAPAIHSLPPVDNLILHCNIEMFTNS